MKKLTLILTLSVFTTFLAAVAIDTYIVFPDRATAQPNTVRVSVEEGPSAHSFDEALWTALGSVASIEAQLPEHLKILEVEIRPSRYITSTIEMTFTRKDLNLLMVGLLAPAQFMRESVTFVL